jgi:subtilisin family serine protease
MEWLMEQGVRVMCLSLGGTGYDAGFDEIVQEVAAANIFPAISIGNEGLGVTGSPGNVLGAVGVGSVNVDEEVSAFSGGGTLTWYDNVGNKQHIEKPELVAPGEGVLSSIPLEYGQPYLKLSGTSMAAPHVAGLAALMVQKKRSATFPELLRAMQKTAKRLVSTGSANRSGFGLIQGFEAVQAL